MVQSWAEIQSRWYRVKSDHLEEGSCTTARCVVYQWDEDCLRKDKGSLVGIKVPQLQALGLNAKLPNSLETYYGQRLTTVGLQHNLRYCE